MESEAQSGARWKFWDWGAASFLFVATAAVVWWQNSRLAVLWDLSYILENSYRISLGQVPYRDFPFPYAPLTFLVQALLIRLTGRVFLHHVVYCAVVGGAGTVLTWRILVHVLRETVSAYRLVAFLLAIPLVPLGIYCVFPHPFYDPDCTFVILCCVLLLLRLDERNFPAGPAFLAGMLCIVPVFVKQNTGLAFAPAAAIAVAALAARAARRHERAAGYASLLGGMLAGFIAAILAIHFTAGLGNYARWTLRFAAARRLPPFSEMIAAYENPLLLVWFASFALGGFLAIRCRASNKVNAIPAVVLLAAPFAWPVLYLFSDADSSERAEQLLALWPVLMAVSLGLALWNVPLGLNVRRLLPLILVATVQGAFLSQQLWGSTYAIWPLLLILVASVLVELLNRARGPSSMVILGRAAGVASVCLLIAGGYYTASHERLDYANVSDGPLTHSTLPALASLSMRGPWIPRFEELVRYSDREIPRNEGLLMIPGEDLFYYATGRRPGFPVLMFDHTVNPYRPEQILELARERNICWLVVKKQLQLNGEPVEDKDRLLDLLRAEFTKMRELTNYDVYRRSSAASCSALLPQNP